MPPRRRRVRITLPHLTGAEALHLAAVLERLVRALWRAHGNDMADALAEDRSAPDMRRIPTQSYVVDSGRARPSHHDDDIPF